MTPSSTEDSDVAALSTLLQILRYQPTVIPHMEDLLDAVASHLPRVIARYIVESPMSGPLAMPIEGTVVFADIDGFTQLSEKFAHAASWRSSSPRRFPTAGIFRNLAGMPECCFSRAKITLCAPSPLPWKFRSR